VTPQIDKFSLTTSFCRQPGLVSVSETTYFCDNREQACTLYRTIMIHVAVHHIQNGVGIGARDILSPEFTIPLLTNVDNHSRL
jgi:hypothetical protein